MEPKSSIDRATAANEVQIVALADTSARPAATHSEESFTKSITAAAHAYDAKARELHGEFARLNFPEAKK